ncbi:hypothetical protein F4677DRAFT_429557, partial [Hypoxylon crocopeplum]
MVGLSRSKFNYYVDLSRQTGAPIFTMSLLGQKMTRLSLMFSGNSKVVLRRPCFRGILQSWGSREDISPRPETIPSRDRQQRPAGRY